MADSQVEGLIQQVKINNSIYNLASTAYGVCDTLADEPVKLVSMPGFELKVGVTVHIKFTYNNTASNPQLNIATTGAKSIVQYGTTAVANSDSTSGWYAGAVISFTYDGTSWVRDQGFNTNTQDNYGNITTDGKIGTTANLAVYTTTGGLVTAGTLKTDAPSASGTATAFITSVSQDSKGKISASKANLPTASSSTAGITKVGASDGAAAYSHNHDASDINSGTLNTNRLPDDVVKKRTSLTSATTELDLLKLNPGMYDHTTNSNNLLPTSYGTILNIHGLYKYGALIAAESDNTLYHRAYHYDTDESWQWRGNWQMNAHADAGTSIGNDTTPIYITQSGVIKAGTALKALAYKDSLVAADIPDLSSTYLKLDGSNNMTADINIIARDTDKFVNFWYDTNKKAGASWRIGELGSGSDDANYFVIQSGTSTTSDTDWTNALRIGMNTHNIYIPSTTASTSTSTGALTVGGGLGVAGQIVAGTLKSGNITIGGTIDTNAGKTFGSNSTLYINRGSSCSIIFQENGTNKLSIDTSNNFIPATTNTLSIGTSNKKWNAMYATTFYGDLSGTFNGYRMVSPTGSPQVWYKYTMTYTTTTVPTTDWYVKIILNRSYEYLLTPILIIADYSNKRGSLYWDLDSYNNLWRAYLTTYNTHNIKAIGRRYENSKNNLYIQFAAPEQYGGSVPQGTFTIYSPVEIVSIEQLNTVPSDLQTLYTGYNSNTHIKAANLYGTLATDNLSGQVAIANGGTGASTAAEAWTALGGGASGKHADTYFVKAITSTTNGIPRFDGTTGQVKDSQVIIDDSNNVTIPGSLTIYKEEITSANASARITFTNKDTTNNQTSSGYIAYYNDHSTSYNGNLIIHSSGGTFIGGGESAGNLYAALGSTTSSENLYLSADGAVYIEGSADTIANRMGIGIVSGNVIPVKAEAGNNNAQSLGTSNVKWAAVYATSFIGNGSALTNLNASNISSGTLNADRLATSGAVAGSYGDSSNQTPNYEETFKVPYVTVDNKGRVTAISEHTVQIPASDVITTWYCDGQTGTGHKAKIIPTTAWSDTGIKGDDIPTAGSYIIQAYVNYTGTGSLSNYDEYYTGIMSWYAILTNSSDYDEIYLHKAGHASNGNNIYLRTVREAANINGNQTGRLKLQISANKDCSAEASITFKFRKMI